MSEIVAHDLQQVGLPALLEHFLEFVADVEVIFDGLLAAAGDDDDLVAARGQGLFDAVLNDGLVDQRQHFFGLGFGGGQKTRAQAGGGKTALRTFMVMRRSILVVGVVVGVTSTCDLYLYSSSVRSFVQLAAGLS